VTTLSICVVPGDGIGPEVVEAAVRVLEAVRPDGVDLAFEFHAAGAGAYLATGEAFPAATRRACRAADAVLHGAAGLPEVVLADGTEAGQDFSMQIRAGLDLFANIRPLRLLPGVPRRLAGDRPVDFTIVRENTEGLYASRGGGTLVRDEVATDTLVQTRRGIERVVHVAAELARRGSGAPSDGVKRVTVVDKANVLRSYAFFRRVADEVLAQYGDVQVEHLLVDAMALHLVERPERFDVVVTENIFGDILSDLGAALIGGLGMAPSAELGERHGLFQGSHGTAPSLTGTGRANPLACVLSAALMLDRLSDTRALPALADGAERMRRAVSAVVTDGLGTPDIGGRGTTASVTEAVIAGLDDAIV